MRISDWSSDVCSSDLTSLSVSGIGMVTVRSFGGAFGPVLLVRRADLVFSVIVGPLPCAPSRRCFERYRNACQLHARPAPAAPGRIATRPQGLPLSEHRQDRKSTRLNSSH